MTRLVKRFACSLAPRLRQKKVLKKEKFDLSALTESVVAKQEINAKSAHLTLTYEPLSAQLMFDGDRDAMEQVLVNIISNAIKYTGSDGKIYVASGKMYDSVYIKIKDNGIGIPKEDLPHIFERFYRVDKARSREKGGTGLGLAISHDIIAAHGGSIKINSIYGAGTEVVIILPTGKKAVKKPEK
ncbi:MAG: cell wall metabolism sensor histidine kinase WalK [Clostridiales bacterium]|nr:MAG: cell wall metabolism sensor histidine kinase WalK [Clostridiales bacterium]